VKTAMGQWNFAGKPFAAGFYLFFTLGKRLSPLEKVIKAQLPIIANRKTIGLFQAQVSIENDVIGPDENPGPQRLYAKIIVQDLLHIRLLFYH
jgi:hypothetical protein